MDLSLTSSLPLGGANESSRRAEEKIKCLGNVHISSAFMASYNLISFTDKGVSLMPGGVFKIHAKSPC